MDRSQASFSTSTPSAAPTPMYFSFSPLTVDETSSTCKMHSVLSCLFKDITTLASSHILTLLPIISPKNHLPIICCFYSHFWMKTSLHSTPSYQLKFFPMCYCAAKPLERYIYTLLLQLSCFKMYTSTWRSSCHTFKNDHNKVIDYFYVVKWSIISNLKKFNNKNSAKHTIYPLLTFTYC